MSNIERERWDIALKRVAAIERRSNVLKSRLLPKKFAYASRSAWSTQEGLEVLPRDQQHQWPGQGQTRARVRADAVLIGKFDVQAEVRLRAFYPQNDRSIRYQAGGKDNGILRTVNAHDKVRHFAPKLMPTIYDHGTILKGRGAYLIEETVEGETATRPQLETIIASLTEQLQQVHEGVGVSDKRASAVLGRHARSRWEAFLDQHSLDPRINERVQQLFNRDNLLEVSLTHGDLVNSNILVEDDRFVLVDWEWSSTKPIAFDMAKIIINVSDLNKFLHEMHTGLGSHLGARQSHYTFREQVALALVQTLTFYTRQSVKARKANRTAALKRQTTKRVNALTELLELT